MGQVAGERQEVPTSLVIWTTTPWTLPANRAVAVHPQFDYALIEFDLGRGAERLVLAGEFIDAVTKTFGIGGWRFIPNLKSAALQDLPPRHPLFHRQVPRALGGHVSLDDR